ncbi:MAG TPA: LysR family transcriptional regulator [Casimicrobiaceae bacterium]|nr:LysR family transcriptional regulator [Casimicrobiaceae bacterium]
MNVTLAQLRAFERIVRLGSFHAAARELNLTQPSVSQRIRELEGVLRTRLFVRRGPRISLTAEGHALLEYADRMLDTAGEMVERFHTRDPLNGMLRLGLNESFALICLPELLQRLEQRYPGIKTSVFVGDTGLVSQSLNRKELDIAIVSEPKVGAHVRMEPIGRNRLGWFASADFDLARGVLTPADLCQFHLIVSPPTAQLHATATQWFSRAGAVPRRVSTCNSLSATILTILHGTAIGLVPVRVMQEELAGRRVKRVRVAPEMPAHRVTICYQVSEFGPGLKVLVDMTRELVARHKLFV